MSEEAIYKLRRSPDGKLEEFEYVKDLVRCGDCKHWSIEPAMHCTEHFRMVDADFFCADGEVRDE